ALAGNLSKLTDAQVRAMWVICFAPPAHEPFTCALRIPGIPIGKNACSSDFEVQFRDGYENCPSVVAEWRDRAQRKSDAAAKASAEAEVDQAAKQEAERTWLNGMTK